MTEEHLEFLKKEAERCNISVDELREEFCREADREGVSMEAVIDQEIAAWMRMEENPLTREQLKEYATRCNPDPRFFEGDEENPFE